MERTCFLMIKVLRMSIHLLQLNSAMKRDIDALGGIEVLREAMERGFCKQLKYHASKSYLRATQNHFECAQDLGTVNEEYGEFEEVPSKDKHSKPTGSNAASPPKSYAQLLEEQLFSALESSGAVDIREFPTVRRGIKQSMTILARSNVHPVEGSHFTCEILKRLLIQTGNDDFRNALKAEQSKGAEDGAQAFSDEPCSKRPVGELFGFGATVLGYIMPKLNQKVINAAQCG
eukprot:2098978-Amphidinium_carterae.1